MYVSLHIDSLASDCGERSSNQWVTHNIEPDIVQYNFIRFQVRLVDEAVAGAEVTLEEGVDQLVVEGVVEVANKITDRNTDFLLVLYLKNLYIAT